jgi:peptidoglycan/LPS O-acetylase OafA/YrhL
MEHSIKPMLYSARAWVASGPTVSQRMAEANNRASGFDYLRLGLATTILIFHDFEISHAKELVHFIFSGPGRVVRNVLVPMFFGLGGFLVAGSLDRTKSLITFLGLRTLRIFPALWADILFSALVLGPLVTTLPHSVYFTAPEFYKYFLNLIGEIH